MRLLPRSKEVGESPEGFLGRLGVGVGVEMGASAKFRVFLAANSLNRTLVFKQMQS